MILEIDTSILDRISDLSMNQLVFLTLVLSDNQPSIKTFRTSQPRLMKKK